MRGRTSTLLPLFSIMTSRDMTCCTRTIGTRLLRRACCCFASWDTGIPISSSTSIEEISEAFRSALEHKNGADTGLSPQLVRGLLLPPGDITGEGSNDIFATLDDDEAHSQQEEDQRLIYRGLPKRPFYRELARRVLLLSQSEYNEESRYRPLIDAEILGMKEESPTPIPSPPKQCSQSACTNWLRSAGDSTILEILGVRHTIGTQVGLLPPEWPELLQAAQAPHRQNAAPHDNLTVSGRARCKHAHRGSGDNFFGVVKGGTREKNEAANKVIIDLLRNAVWVNIHTFGSMDKPSLEVRVESGYGARWTADWSPDPVQPRDITFRGFLEPQMVNGHENRWRH